MMIRAAIQYVQAFKDRDIHRKHREYQAIINRIRARDLGAWDDQRLREASLQLREDVISATGAFVSDHLVEACALVCEAARRTVGLAPYDVQIMAALALQEGYLIEQYTGEGKTLSAVMPAYLHALKGKGVHVLTFNDYLAKRDAQWMGPIYRCLGLTVEAVQSGMSLSDKRLAYAADVTYVTAKEAGFDYLRDTIVRDQEQRVHRPFHVVIVDEADSLLLDEARVPLVIADASGDVSDDSHLSRRLAELARELAEPQYHTFDAYKRNVYLSESGSAKAEADLSCGNLYEQHNSELLMALHCALHAELLLHKDIDYMVRDNQIMLIDEYTGRVAENRHLPDGLQAALADKEGLTRPSGGRILGTITLQHFLSLYPKMCGMTATAQASAMEFDEIYNLQVMPIPSNVPNQRVDHPHRVYTHKDAKIKDVVKEIQTVHASGRPILIGTASVEESEMLAALLAEADVPCQVLNAKNDAKEALLIARAGELGAVTVSTNMAGRGVDIRLGGQDPVQAKAVAELGGLYVIGTNLHQSVRIDRQLRGRAGRQGDPGSSVFYLCLEDEQLVKFGIHKFHHPDHQDQVIEDPALHEEIAHIQRVMMGQNFHLRQELNRYSDMVEEQRRLLYEERTHILEDRQGMSRSEQRVRLYYMDKYWADHLAYASFIRESIHLTSLTNRNPIDEYHNQLIQAYEQMRGKVERASQQMLEKLGDANDEETWALLGLKSPMSTRTYTISDQYIEFMQNTGAWGPGMVLALWLRRIVRPLFGWEKM